MLKEILKTEIYYTYRSTSFFKTQFVEQQTETYNTG